MEKYRFYKDLDNKWYIDLPDFIEAGGSKSALEMVLGADSFLERLTPGPGYREVFLELSDSKPFDRSMVYSLAKSPTRIDSGCFYVNIDSVPDHIHVMWLCDVVKFVFNGQFPYRIYFNKITKEDYEARFSGH